jgi:hypothetical protein
MWSRGPIWTPRENYWGWSPPSWASAPSGLHLRVNKTTPAPPRWNTARTQASPSWNSCMSSIVSSPPWQAPGRYGPSDMCTWNPARRASSPGRAEMFLQFRDTDDKILDALESKTARIVEEAHEKGPCRHRSGSRPPPV